MLMAVFNAKVYLERANSDHFEASKLLHRDYQRGYYTEDEYLEMMDVLASKMMWEH